MTCVLGMVVRREREIRSFVKTPFYRVIGHFSYNGKEFDGEWKAVKGSGYFQSPLLYKENGFKEKKDAAIFCQGLGTLIESNNKDLFPYSGNKAIIEKAERKKEKKNPPLLFNLAELQNTCSKLFKTSPDETLKIVQELYEKKLVTYPRTDARVLSTAVAKEIKKNLTGLLNYGITATYTQNILNGESYKNIAKTRYVNDKQITDHYAIIPTGQGLFALKGLGLKQSRVYEVIVRRFLCIFYPPAEYMKTSLSIRHGKELFFASFKVLISQGYLELATASFAIKEDKNQAAGKDGSSTADGGKKGGQEEDVETFDKDLIDMVKQLKKGMETIFASTEIKEGETSPPKRYNSGSIILAMENAGQLIEDEDLRAQIKGSGIGTSATRAEILSKLVKIKYLNLNKKTQIITPELIGEMVYDVVNNSIRSLLNPELTASWELGLALVAEGKITEEEYMKKLDDFITKRVEGVKTINNSYGLRQYFDAAAAYYKDK